MKNNTTYSIMTEKEWVRFYDKIVGGVNETPSTLRKRLNHCQAWIYPEIIIDDNVYIPLISYETVVAVYDKTTDMVIRFGYFSATTTQHTAKFKALMREKYHNLLSGSGSYWKVDDFTYYLFRNERGYYGERIYYGR